MLVVNWPTSHTATDTIVSMVRDRSECIPVPFDLDFGRIQNLWNINHVQEER